MQQPQLRQLTLASAHDTGTIGIRQLKRFWSGCLLKRVNMISDSEWQADWQLNKTLLNVLGIGLEPTIQYVFNESPSFGTFEHWVIHTAGIPDAEDVARYNQLFDPGHIATESRPVPVLTAEQMTFWDRNGYVVIKGVIPPSDCAATVNAICDFIGVKENQPSSWYSPHVARQGIMVQLFQHPLLQKNRKAEKIRLAYEQLWDRKDLWLNTDRVGFNPPECANWQFPGPDLHWDCSLELPLSFGLQGILYLTDTAANQGAFTLVPGFQHRIDQWLRSLPADANPATQDLHALGSQPVVANAGDFIIWHHALPHGSSRNTADKPRFVQYINYAPADI